MLYVLLAVGLLGFGFFIFRMFMGGDKRLLSNGERLEKEGKYDDAFFAYEHAVRVDPENGDARWRLANLAYKRGALSRAVSEFQSLLAIAKFPEGVREYDVRYMLGRAYMALDSLPNAFVEFYRIQQQNPGHAAANVQLGLIYAGQERLDTALKHIKRAVGMDPGNAEAHYYLGLIHAEKGNFQEAIAELEKTTRIAPQNVHANYYLGMFYKDRNMLVDAIRRFQQVVNSTQDPKLRLEGYRLLGLCYKEKGLIDETITNYEVAASQMRNIDDIETQKDILYNLGMAYTKKGEGNKAMAAWKNIEQVDSSYKDVQELINKGARGFDMKEFQHAVNSWDRLTSREGTRLRGAGLLKSKKRFDIDRLIQELGGGAEDGADLKKDNQKPLTERFLDLNNKQFVLVVQKMLRLLGFTLQKAVSSNEDTDFEEGKAVAYVATRKDPKTRKVKTYMVQVRRWRENVGPIPIGNSLDMMQELNLEHGFLFVSSMFTDAALNVARRDGRLQLVDRRGMIKVLKKIMN